MKVFIFGAGASKAAQPSHEHVPGYAMSPLADGLFDDRYRNYIRHTGLTRGEIEQFLVDKGSDSVETYLTKKWDQVKNLNEPTAYASKAVFGKLSFYIWRLFLEVSKTYRGYSDTEQNGYYAFLQKLKVRQDQFGLISFNYDTLLDQALEDVFHTYFVSKENYLNNDAHFSYLKPHGSINWFLAKGADDADISIGNEGLFDLEHRFRLAGAQMYNKSPREAEYFEVIDPSHKDLNGGSQDEAIITNLIVSRFGGEYFYPLVLIPLTTKLYSSLNGFVDQMIGEGKRLIADATEVFLIGYRAEDAIIKDIFADARPETVLHVVSRDDAAAIMERVLAWSPMTQGKILRHGFENFTANY